MKSLNKLFYPLILVSVCSAGNIMPESYYEIIQWEPLKYGTFENYHLPSHMFTAAVATRIITEPKVMGSHLPDPKQAVKYIVIGACVFEVIEYAVEGTGPYATDLIYFYDTAGDILWAWFIASMVAQDRTKTSLCYNPLTKQFQISWEF
ncbi:MAG: hypothetical protein H8E14_06025 [Candidatus Marinimicrobia bacterium]|nr:hypothetical protein [Candidatus Neomarinimicrobiota bacterium]